MSRLITKTSRKAGQPPGHLVHVGERKAEQVKVTLFDYSPTECEERAITEVSELSHYRDKKSITWVNVDGLHDVEVLEELGRCFGLHPLILEDVLNVGQRPKVEVYDQHIFIVAKMLTYDDANHIFQKENLSLVFGPMFILTFQEQEGDLFDVIRQRIRNNEGRVRKSGPDYLAYRIMDTIVDHFFIVLEKYGDRIEALELELMEGPSDETLERIYRLKRELLLLRKPMWSSRELLSSVQKEETLIKRETQLFLRDVYDHSISTLESLESFRELVGGMLDMYLSIASNRMNEVMKVLTIIATIFIPLTFIAGIYGMNFEVMPELKWHWGYLGVWILMASTGLFMVFYMKRKKWL